MQRYKNVLIKKRQSFIKKSLIKNKMLYQFFVDKQLETRKFKNRFKIKKFQEHFF